jgi:hypothetical protein
MSEKHNVEDAIALLEKKFNHEKDINDVKTTGTLFDNPMIDSAIRAMSVEQREAYKKMGQHMYGSIDFKDNKILNAMPVAMEEALAYVIEGIKSGLHPKEISEDEKTLLIAGYGDKWYTEFGYADDEMKD